MIKYLENHTVTETAIRFRISRKTVYKWLKRYDGMLKSLEDRSHRPHHSPRAHTEEELKLIRRLAKKHKWKDLILFFQELRDKYGYKRSYGGMKRVISRMKKAAGTPKKPKRKPKPYKRADYIGQKVQVDVKFVPSECVMNGNKYYVYVAVDECSRWCYREMYEEHSTYSSTQFLNSLIKHAPFPIKRIQTDNGSEFTNILILTKGRLSLFEKKLEKFGIEYQRIRVATPRHNGKVERQNRQDGDRFYDDLKMYSLEDGRKQLAVYQKKSNNYIKTCLNMLSPNQVVKKYLGVMW
ncbi:MAG: DDE-type integrase/transposase/recombinase [Clostridiales bacterium]|nr:DDE-type integrase/transposase/recombinase [Clostridiales bacterium]